MKKSPSEESTRGLYIAGQWMPASGESLRSIDPVTTTTVWSGQAASPVDIEAAIAAARAAAPSWRSLSTASRREYLERFANLAKEHRTKLAELISREVGKPTWEALTEVDAVVGKVAPTVEAYEARMHETERVAGSSVSHTRFRPFGVAVVLSPFNFPVHMANGHIMPALLAGNTVVLKPSELSPGVAEHIVGLWEQAGLPPGVLNLVQGNSAIGEALVRNPGVDAVYFTGGLRGGISISSALSQTPWKIAALEMGGNSPLVVWDYNDLKAALYTALFSAFVTAGQRCSGARRLVVPSTDDDFVAQLVNAARQLRVGHYTLEPEPFMGPMVRRDHALAVIDAQDRLTKAGGVQLLPTRLLDDESALITPGVIDVTQAKPRFDEEILGPLLQVVRVESFEDAIREANRTKFGLAAGLVSRDPAKFASFVREVRAGVINWNQPLPGASPYAPFGGVGASGNSRPSGFYAADYCSYPIASMESESPVLPQKLPPGLPL